MTVPVVIVGDCVEAMRAMPDASVDSIVTDPPYGLGFMGKQWDDLPPGIEWAGECLRVLKPGGHLLAFGGTRTYHRLTCAIEDAGFEIRDCLAWLYGSGFPKSHDVSKAIDKAAGAEREIVGDQPDRWTGAGGVLNFATDRPQESVPITGAPATPDAETWAGWGTALKPAHEPVVMARKPLVGTVAANVLEHGTGAVNVDGCRIEGALDPANVKRLGRDYTTDDSNLGLVAMGQKTRAIVGGNLAGRWPANVLLDPEAAGMLDAQTGEMRDGVAVNRNRREIGAVGPHTPIVPGTRPGPDLGYGGGGGASRFFYVAKASTRERNGGLDDRNPHPTVKPIELMRWLVRLVTPPGGLVLDPFTGSGTTGVACALEGFEFTGIEREPEYAAIAEARIAHWRAQPSQLDLLGDAS